MIVHYYGKNPNYKTVKSLCGIDIEREVGRTFNSNWEYRKTDRNKITHTVEKVNCLNCLKLALIKKNDEAAKIASRIKEIEL